MICVICGAESMPARFTNGIVVENSSMLVKSNRAAVRVRPAAIRSRSAADSVVARLSHQTAVSVVSGTPADAMKRPRAAFVSTSSMPSTISARPWESVAVNFFPETFPGSTSRPCQ